MPQDDPQTVKPAVDPNATVTTPMPVATDTPVTTTPMSTDIPVVTTQTPAPATGTEPTMTPVSGAPVVEEVKDEPVPAPVA